MAQALHGSGIVVDIPQPADATPSKKNWKKITAVVVCVLGLLLVAPAFLVLSGTMPPDAFGGGLSITCLTSTGALLIGGTAPYVFQKFKHLIPGMKG